MLHGQFFPEEYESAMVGIHGHPDVFTFLNRFPIGQLLPVFVDVRYDAEGVAVVKPVSANKTGQAGIRVIKQQKVKRGSVKVQPWKGVLQVVGVLAAPGKTPCGFNPEIGDAL